MKEERQTFKEMLMGIAIVTVLVGAIGYILVSNKLAYILGVLLGSIVAIIILMQMYYTLSKAVDMEEKSASRYSVATSMIRTLLMAVALVVGIVWPDYFNIIGILFGLFTLKICAYMQPLIHKVLS